MKKLLYSLFLISTIGVAQKKILLSDQAKISVITCGPSQEELYTAFGHSAFRVSDPSLGMDEVYNYGVFDFDQPNFYLNFARGYLYYKLGVHDYPLFRDYYIRHNRYIHEQVLDLNPRQVQKMYDFLQWNARPENVNYRYDYFYDNCATKIRDVYAKVLGDSAVFDGSYVTTDYTIRDLTDLYLKQQPWGDLGIDICLGLPMDKKASPYEYMFLPDYIESGFDHATLKNDSAVRPAVKEKVIVNESRDEKVAEGLPHPRLVFGLVTLLAIILTVWDGNRKKLSTWFDAILFGVVGVVGVLLLFLWLATDHKAAAKNFNLLWALPSHVVAAIAFIKNPRWLPTYFLVTLGICILLLISWVFLPQQLNTALIPIVVMLGVRSYAQFSLRKSKGL